MAEPFLINPYRLSRKRRTRSRVRRRSGGRLPGKLLSRMMRTYGPGRGMKEAWSAYRGGVRRNDPDSGLFNPRKHRRYRRRRLNPFGEEVMIVGANPRRRKRSHRKEVISKMATRRRRKVRVVRVRSRRRRAGGRRRRFSIKSLLRRVGIGRHRRRRRAVAANPRRRRYRRRRAMLFNDNPRRRRHRGRRRAMFFDNPRHRRYRRRFRSNPRRRRGGLAGAASLPAISFRRPMSLIMPAVVGTAAYIATEKIPSMVNVTTTLPRLGVKAAVGFGGGILISKFLGRSNGAVWAIGSSINILSDILRTYVFTTGGLLGMGAFPYQRGIRYSGYDGLSAYPQEAEGGYPM